MANSLSQWLERGFDRIAGMFGRDGLLKLRYFEDVLVVEFRAINARRRNHGRPDIAPLNPTGADPRRTLVSHARPESTGSRGLSPDPEVLFASVSGDPAGARRPALERLPPESKSSPYDKTRPQPVPCDANGLAFSGGGIRSAAVCLGALQALHARHILRSIDYLSTVSGGGYIGSCLSAAMSPSGGRRFPFGDDFFDSAAVAHLRNFSNYLMPRGRSGARNAAEAAAVILRGLVANLVIVLATMLLCVLITLIAYPAIGRLNAGSFVPLLIDGVFGAGVNDLIGAHPFRLTLWLIGLVVVTFVVWAMLRSYHRFDPYTDDAQSGFLAFARILLIATVASAFLDLQPIAIAFTADARQFFETHKYTPAELKTFVGALTAFTGAISAASSFLGNFLKTTEHSTDWTTLALRLAVRVAIFLAALVLPIAIWIVYLELSLWGMNGATVPDVLSTLGPTPASIVHLYIVGFCIALLIMSVLQANGYSLHRFYRDRLSPAFLFGSPPRGAPSPVLLDKLKLSQLEDNAGPYHIVNSALNVEGSKEANRRGRNADFFMFTRDFVGSDLTHYARTQDMESIDPRLDLGTAMAVSGAAVSANMGAYTVRLLSPTLALLNIRLGYWLRNPLDLATRPGSLWRRMQRGAARLLGKFYLLLEMLNQLDETSRQILLTDGGHIENLGVYELLKRGCQLIIVVDVETDPSMSYGALLTLERYARIDLGVRLSVPWEDIAAMTKSVDAHLQDGPVCAAGPHCAIGRIFYQTGAEGIMLYFKSSLTGDEKDYILDYKKRFPAFPHEATGDQFFSEEQFEVYRALGYHMVDGVFGGSDNFCFPSTGDGAFPDRIAAVAAVRAMLGAGTPEWA